MGRVVSRKPGNFREVMRVTARRIAAADPNMTPEQREVFAQHAIWAGFREVCGDDRVRLRAPKVDPTAREARAKRIEHALQAGESVSIVAQRERIPYRTAYDAVMKARSTGSNRRK